MRGEVTKAEVPHGEQRCVRTQCVFVNLCLCTQGRNTLIDTLVRDTADSCKHCSDTYMQENVQACTRTHTHSPLQSNTIKPFSGCFFFFPARTCLNMQLSLNINSGYIKAALRLTPLCDGRAPAPLLPGCSRTWCDRGGQQARGVPRAH